MEPYYGEIPEFEGAWGNANTLEDCREDVQDALEGWIILGFRLGHSFPIIDGIDLNIMEELA
ncbi:MAG: type II toxin-antitoxin system HicB family antitoxin [Crocosphaera sp.]